MELKEFETINEKDIVRNGIIFRFRKIDELSYVLIASLRTVPHYQDGFITHEWIDLCGTMDTNKAFFAYNNLLNGGLE